MRDATRITPETIVGCVALSVAASLFASVAHGQALQDLAVEQQGLNERPAPGTWSVALGAGLADRPDYPGSSHYQVRPVPLIAIGYGDRVSAGPFGLGFAAIDWKGLRAGPVLGIEAGRRESVDSHLNGLGDISTSVTGGAFVSYRVGVFDIYGTARQAINNSGSGLAGLVQFNFRQTLVPRRLYLIAGPDVEFGNREHEQTWFGVTPTQSLQSGLPAYTPGGGVNTVGVHAALTYRASEHVFWRAFANLKDLAGQAADSPIVERRTEYVIGLGAAYHF
jgi:outer membrane scaffolding protein for murein synthesis (MipA/OmpV family)